MGGDLRLTSLTDFIIDNLITVSGTYTKINYGEQGHKVSIMCSG